MEGIINFFLTYFNPIKLLNMLWELIIDVLYLVAQFFIDTLVALIAAINWLCPSFERVQNLTVPPAVASAAKAIAWIIPWNYALDLLMSMMCFTMLSIMFSWTLRWLKVIR